MQPCEAEILAGQYHSNIKPAAVMASVCAFEMRYDLPVVFVPSPGDGARLIERWSFHFAREAVTMRYLPCVNSRGAPFL
jgi:hypothetical protein